MTCLPAAARSVPAGRAAVLAGGTFLALLALRLDVTPLLRGPAPYPPEWQWAAAARPWSLRVLPALGAATALGLLLAGCGRVGGARRPRLGWALVLAAATALGLSLQLGLRHVDDEGAVAGLVRRTISGSFTSYHRVAVSGMARDPRRFVAHYHQLLPGYRHRALHVATHPPGPVLFYRGLLGLCHQWTWLTERLNDRVAATALEVPTLASPPPSPPAIGAALLGPVLIGLLAAAACWPTASLARSLHGDATAALRTGVLWTLVPGVALMSPEMDQALTLPVTASVAALAAALRPDSTARRTWIGYAVGAGVLAAVAGFFSYGAAVFIAIGGLAVLAFALPGARGRAPAVAGLAFAGAAVVLALERLAGHRPLASALTALTIHRQHFTLRRSYLTWLAFDPIDLFWFLGPPLALLVAAVGVRALRAARGETPVQRFQAAAVLGLAGLVLSGIVRGEVGRILIPLMPLLLVAAVADAGGAPPGPARAGPSVGLAVLLAVLLAATSVVIRLTWEVP